MPFKIFFFHETGALGGNDSMEVHMVSTNGEVYTEQFFFVWAQRVHNEFISYLLIFGTLDFGTKIIVLILVGHVGAKTFAC